MQSLIIVIAGIVVVVVILIFGRVFRFFANRPAGDDPPDAGTPLRKERGGQPRRP
jgi:hypothetical protein